MMCDALGLPIKFILTGGEVSDFKQAIQLLGDEKADYVLGDRGFDSDEIVEHISEKMCAIPVIPPKSNRLVQRRYDKYIYKERNLIERLFNKLKNFRKIATRYEKIQQNFEALICLACTFLWLI
jgi:transposase